MDDDGIAELERAPVARDDVNDCEVEATAVDLGVVVSAVCEERNAGLFEPRDVRRVVHDAHRVGLGKADADRMRERVARGIERRIDEVARHAQAAGSSVGWMRTVVSLRCRPDRPER